MLAKSKPVLPLLLILSLASLETQAAEDNFGLAFEGGWSEDDSGAERAGLAFQSNLWMPSYTMSEWQLAAYWEISASYWGSDPGPTGVDSLGEFGLTPFIRLQPVYPLFFGVRPFIEGGVGVHATTADGISKKDFGSEFAFGNHAGAGLRYGNFDISYRFQHLSNAGLADPNAGIDFHLLRLGYHF
jgi:lipid A 3-O-deacylase